ncbi:MAG: MptD family putative ECF transporter S component [Suipraeoptans sp.]
MKVKRNKLGAKDLIVAGAFAALYVVLLMVVVSLLGFIPITYILAPFFISVVLGPVYMLYVMKVPKTGAIIILAAVVGLVTSMGGVWYAFIWSMFLGIIAELIARAGRYKSKKMYGASFSIFACANMGPFLILAFSKSTFLKACLEYYGQDYVDTLDRLTPSWIILALMALAFAGGIIGSIIGTNILKKHFEKAGIV